MREAQRISFDEEAVHQSIDILSSELLQHFYGEKATNNRLLADKILVHQAANKEFLAPTVAGILMFTEEPDLYLPEALIRCTRFRGLEGRDIIRTEEITGPINQQAVTALKVLESWLAMDYPLQGAQLKGRLPVPAEALREAILNALLHRKYTIVGAVKIAVYDDRVEIFSPGCFPVVVDRNHLGDGTRVLRNPVLVKLARHMKLIETLGTGIRLIFDSCHKAGIVPPVYHDEGDFVKVIFYFRPNLEQKSETEALLALMQSVPQITAGKVAAYLGVSRNTAIRKLNALVQSEQIIKVGRGAEVVYKYILQRSKK